MSSRAPVDEDARNQMSVDALNRGDLPVSAQERIARQASKQGGFTSDLSVNEFLAIKQCGFEAVSQVMGSCVYQIAYSGMCNAAGSYGSFATTEMTPYADAMGSARATALSRLQKEAAGVGGHGVVGVRLVWRYLPESRGLMEFTAIGTAIRRAGAAPLAQPFLSAVSGQEFAKLFRNGYVPCGLVLGISAYQIHPGWGGRYQQQSWNNQEMGQFTDAVGQARHSAMNRLYQQLQALGADGCVGTSVGMQVTECQCYYTRGMEREELEDKMVQFHALGTAVVRFSTTKDVAPIGIVRRLDDFVSTNVEVDV